MSMSTPSFAISMGDSQDESQNFLGAVTYVAARRGWLARTQFLFRRRCLPPRG